MTTLPWDDPETKEYYDPSYVDFYTKTLRPAVAEAIAKEKETLDKIEDPLLKERATANIAIEVQLGIGYLPIDSFKDEVIVSDDSFPSIDGTTIPIRVYKPKNVKPNNALFINYHGGGFVLGDLEFDKFQNYWLVHSAGVTIIDVDYRLIPEWTFSTSFYDSYAALKYAYDNHAKFGIDPNKISIGGTSAGGKIVIATAQVARDLQIPLKLAIANVLPGENFLDVLKPEDAVNSASLIKFANDPSLSFEVGIRFFEEARRLAETKSQRIDQSIVDKAFASSGDNLRLYEGAILEASNYKDLAKHIIYVADHDILKSGGKAYAKKLIDNNIEVTFRNAKGLGHHHSTFTKHFKESRKYLNLVVSDLKRLQAGELE